MTQHAFWGIDPSGHCTCADCNTEEPIPFFAEQTGADMHFVTFGEVALVMTGQQPYGLDIGWGK